MYEQWIETTMENTDIREDKNSAVKNFTGSDRKSCEICGLSHIHKNDFENHINSYRHQKKLRQLERQQGNIEEEKFTCEVCKRKFKGEEYYNAHLGSKTHRRNLRKQEAIKGDGKGQAEAPPSGQVTRAGRRFRKVESGDHFKALFRLESFRKKYKIRNEGRKEDVNYKPYIYSLTAYFCLRLALDQNIDDFTISTNDKEWDVFGDLVITVVSKGKKTVYAIQCKRITNTPRQIETLEGAKVYIGKQYTCLSLLRDAGRDVRETKFIIFTTCSTTTNFNQSVTLKSAVLKKWTNEDILDAELKVKRVTKKNEIINVTGDPENVYSFTLSENLSCPLPQLFLYTSQRVLPKMLAQLIKSKFEYSDISADYTKYIEGWVDGKLGGNYKLKKSDIVLKIGEILLKPYIVAPKKVHSKHNSFAVWNQIMNEVDLTVLKNEPFTISKICQPLNMVIEETLSTTIDTITRSVSLKGRNLKDPFKSFFFEIAPTWSNEDIPLHLVYNVFWKAGRIPLLMSTENREEAKEFILQVILFMKQMGVHKKFLIKSADLNLNRFKGSLKIFTSLDDVKHYIDLNEVMIMVSDPYQLSLNAIHSSDKFFFKWITPNLFFDITIGKYSLKPSHMSKAIYSKEDVLKIILNDEEKDKLEKHVYSRYELSETDSGRGSQRLRGIPPGIL